jgi:hypothetical protein
VKATDGTGYAEIWTMPRLRLLSFVAAIVAMTCAPAVARAQTIDSSTPERYSSAGQDLGVATRQDYQNPLGISYADCVADQKLQFAVALSNFTGNASLEVWASLGSTCVSQADRGYGGTAVCWGVAPPIYDPMIPTSATTAVYVRVQDLVGWQSTSPLPSPALTPPAKGAEACTAQPDYPLVQMYINFLAIDDDHNAVGVPYQYAIQTDLVGPPAPDICESVGDTVYNLSWSPNTDSDTIGYGVYIDPIPGQEGDAGRVDAGTIVVCPEAGEAGDEEDDGGCTTFALGSLPPDAGSCGSAESQRTCNDKNLVGAIAPSPSSDAGIPTPTPSNDAGDAGEDGGTTEVGPGGISTVSTVYLYNPSTSNPSITLNDKGTSSYSITGLVDYVTYTVVVTAVDGMGNIGPPSTEVCDYPAPVQDFWQVYEADGGGHGGYCALESVGVGGPSLAGVAGLVVVTAVVRRRRRNQRDATQSTMT